MLNASYFDGQSARQQPVSLTVTGGQLEVHGTDFVRTEPLDNVRISAKLGNTPRLLHFADGGHCEVRDHQGFEALLHESGAAQHTLLSRLENGWHYALAATALTVGFVVATYLWGLPWAADKISAQIPAGISLAIDNHFLEAVDEGLMQPSKLSEKRQQKLNQKFASLHNEEGMPACHLKFRGSKDIGANAFALPGGTIVVTDELVALAAHDEEIIAVLTHELGHVSERHPLRQLLQSSVVGLVMTWYIGDTSTLLAAAPTALLETSYSRNFERRADLFAANILRQNGIKATRLADILEKLESSHTGKKKENKKEKEESSHPVFELFSTHPDTAERIRALRSK
jgi:Zn-dependent protease with chaperone function